MAKQAELPELDLEAGQQVLLHCNSKFEVGPQATGPRSVTGEPFVELALPFHEGYYSAESAKESAIAHFQRYAKGKSGVLYWRVRPEIARSPTRGKFNYYMRLLISDAPAKAEEKRAPVSSDVPDTAIKVYANDWVATIYADMRPDENGYFHVYCTTIGSTQDHARAGAEAVLNAFASGRETFIRERPSATSVTNHVTSETCHSGLTRFSYKLVPGAWSYPNDTIPKSFGEQF